ncbi:MAG: helix-turn-helix transcriptional regulator [Candidatus Dormibacteria bacterium]|jgi:DNA-binding XRE family transcriptional regulator
MVGKEGRESASEGGGPPRLHNRIPVLRAERGLSRQALADLVGVNHQTVGYLERGDYNPSLELALRLSEVFGLPIEAIFSRRPLRPMSEELYGRQRPGEAPPPAPGPGPRPETEETVSEVRP